MGSRVGGRPSMQPWAKVVLTALSHVMILLFENSALEPRVGLVLEARMKPLHAPDVLEVPADSLAGAPVLRDVSK